MLIENQTSQNLEINDLGITVPANYTYDLTQKSKDKIIRSNDLIDAVGAGDLKVIRLPITEPYEYYSAADGIRQLTDAPSSFKLNENGEIQVDMTSKTSEIGSKKLWVHNSAKPEITGKQFFAHYTGCGDNLEDKTIGTGEHLLFELEPGIPKVVKRIEFVTGGEHGDVYVHEAYANWANAGFGDWFTVCVYAKGTPLQTATDLDLVLETHDHGNWVRPAPGGPGTGTHGFAGTPIIVERQLYDGYWDYSSETGLVPNYDGKGCFNISDVDVKVNEFMNHIPLMGSSNGFTRFESDDTAWIPPGYYINVSATNNSNTSWKLVMAMTVFREKTVDNF